MIIIVPVMDAMLVFYYLLANVFLATLLNVQVILQDVPAVNVLQIILYYLLKINVVQQFHLAQAMISIVFVNNVVQDLL